MPARDTIVAIAIELKIDPYLHNTLMRDLVAHDRSASAFLVYFHLYCQSIAIGRISFASSHSVLSDLVGLSMRYVQSAIARLFGRSLMRRRKAGATSVRICTVL